MTRLASVLDYEGCYIIIRRVRLPGLHTLSSTLIYVRAVSSGHVKVYINGGVYIVDRHTNQGIPIRIRTVRT